MKFYLFGEPIKKVLFNISSQTFKQKQNQMPSFESYYTFENKSAEWLAQGIFNEVLNDTNIIHLLENNKYTSSDLDGLLLHACLKGSEKLIMKLLELGANKNAKSRGNSSPIMFLARRDMLEMVKHFIKLEVNVWVHNDNGHNIIEWAEPNVRKYLENNIAVIEKSELESLKEKLKLAEAKNTELEEKKNKEFEAKLGELRDKFDFEAKKNKEFETKLSELRDKFVALTQ